FALRSETGCQHTAPARCWSIVSTSEGFLLVDSTPLRAAHLDERKKTTVSVVFVFLGDVFHQAQARNFSTKRTQ
ncbi:hypothetical protein, partial [Ralstonia solanacearum]|uniref:hypothetical protein n=1 Tax=Ralstonia solanacearum TaxID=305 RepID=UPI00247FC02E